MSVKNTVKKGLHKKKPVSIVSEKVGAHESHPYFVKKKKDAEAFIKRVGLPAGFIEKS